MSILTKSQKKTYGPQVYVENGRTYRITATVRHDDECGNGHNTFAITARIDRKAGDNRWVEDSGGCCHDEVAKQFPELAPLIKYHLMSTDGPLHYIANTVYHVKHDDLQYARESAVWPEATDDELTAPGLEERLKARLPKLMQEFQEAVESLGFIY